MALRDVGVKATIEGLSGFLSGMDQMKSKVNKVSADIGAAGRAFTLLGAPIAALGVIGVKTFADFEKTMARVQAVSGATTIEFRTLEAVAREMGRTTIFSARQSAEALAFMSQAGLEAAEQVEALPKVLELAAAGMLDISQAADIVTNVMAGMKLGVEDLGRANDVLVTAFTSANTNLEQLAQAFKFAGPVASAAGIEFEETAAALALMGNAGLQASVAGTGLRGTITRLLNPSKEAADVLKRLGVIATTSAGDLRPLTEIVGDFEKVGLSAADAMTIFGQRAGPAMLTLVSQGSAALVDLRDQMLSAAGVAGDIATRQMDTFTGQMAELRSVIEGVSIEVGKALVPTLRDLFEMLTPVIQKVANFAEANPKLTLTVVALGVGVTGLGIAMIAFGAILPGVVAALGLFSGAIGFVIIPIAGLVASMIGLDAVMVGSTAVVAAFGVTLNLALLPITAVILGVAALVAAMIIFRDEFAKVFDFIGFALEFWLNNTWIPAINLIISTLNLLPGVGIPTIKKLDLELGKAFLSIADKAAGAVGAIKGLIPSFGGTEESAKSFIDVINETRDAAEVAQTALVPGLDSALDKLGATLGKTTGAMKSFGDQAERFEAIAFGPEGLNQALDSARRFTSMFSAEQFLAKTANQQVVGSLDDVVRSMIENNNVTADSIELARLRISFWETENEILADRRRRLEENREAEDALQASRLIQHIAEANGITKEFNGTLQDLIDHLSGVAQEAAKTAQAIIDANNRLLPQNNFFPTDIPGIRGFEQTTQERVANMLGRELFDTLSGLIGQAEAGILEPLRDFLTTSSEILLRTARDIFLFDIQELRELAGLSSTSGIANTVPSSADRSSTVDSHDVTFNIDANYVDPQEPQSVRLDLESLVALVR